MLQMRLPLPMLLVLQVLSMLLALCVLSMLPVLTPAIRPLWLNCTQVIALLPVLQVLLMLLVLLVSNRLTRAARGRA